MININAFKQKCINYYMSGSEEKNVKHMFKQIILSKMGCAVILAGSDSDKEHIIKVVESLNKYEIPFRVGICSAHKQLKKLDDIIKYYNNIGGSLVYVAIAGGTDALSGILSFPSHHPVISCPPDVPNESCLTNPKESCNAYIRKPENVGRFIAQMYSSNPRFKKLLAKGIEKKVVSLENADIEIQESYGVECLH